MTIKGNKTNLVKMSRWLVILTLTRLVILILSTALLTQILRNQIQEATIVNMKVPIAKLWKISPTPELKRSVKYPCEIKQKGKKRLARPDIWLKNIVKQARNAGEAYVSTTKRKKVFNKREILPPCTEKCRLKCFSKLPENDRNDIFSNYWELKDLQKKRSFIANNMEEIQPKYRYVEEGSHRKNNYAFYFTVNQQKIRVCKRFFTTTISISDRQIRTVASKLASRSVGLGEKLRGKHGRHRSVDNSIKENVRNHINSIPRIPSHYCRASSSKEYIESSKSVADLHRDYKEDCIVNNRPFANYVMYSKIFNEEFNLSFFILKKDQCELCTSYLNSQNADKTALESRYQQQNGVPQGSLLGLILFLIYINDSPQSIKDNVTAIFFADDTNHTAH